MYGLLLKFGAWLSKKAVVAGSIGVVAVVGLGLWLYVKEAGESEVRREALIMQLEEQRVNLEAQRAALTAGLEGWQATAEAQRRRMAEAQRQVERLRAWQSWWRQLTDREQWEVDQALIARLEGLRGEAAAALAAASEALTQGAARLDVIQGEIGETERRLSTMEGSESRAWHYLRAAWDGVKWYLALVLVTYFFGPTVVKVVAYYGLAPLLGRGRPIRFRAEERVAPAVGESRVSVGAKLGPGDVLRVKEQYLQSSDEGLARKTRFVLDWRIPFTSLACGLTELVELRQARASGGGSVTFSTSDNPNTELAMVTIDEGSSLILRPGFLAGVITAPGRPLKIRRRWVLARWQSWVTLRFRYFEFEGPCRLVVAGSRGVRAEVLRTEEASARRAARRTNQIATIGFTPDLDYMPVRAETFWGYYRGMNPLFDDLFAGTGMFLLQETATPGLGGKAGGFWSTVWGGVLKVFGM